MTREEAYDQVAKIAAEHALIAQGFGGVLTIVHPATQREHGIEEKCLFMAGHIDSPTPREPDAARARGHESPRPRQCKLRKPAKATCLQAELNDSRIWSKV